MADRKGIYLTRAKFINWYGFRDEIVPFDSISTLIQGLNESGKSTAVDGISIAEFGDRKTNASSGSRSSARKYITYTRCLLNASPDEYARPREKYKVLYSHVATEWYDSEKNVHFINDTMFETVDMEVQVYRMCIEDKRLEDVCFYEKVPASKARLYSPDEFCKMNGGLIKMSPSEGLDKFFQRKGLRIGRMEQSAFRKRFGNLKTYKADVPIEQFIKESVLDLDRVDISRIKKAQETYKETEENWNNINKQVVLLANVTDAYEAFEDSVARFDKADIKRHYKAYLEDQKALDEAEERIKKAIDSLAALDAERSVKGEQRDTVSQKLFEENARLEGTGFAASLKTQKEIIDKLEARRTKSAAEAKRLERCRQEVADMAEMIESLSDEDKLILKDVSDDKADAAEKLSAIRHAGTLARKEYQALNSMEGPILTQAGALSGLRERRRVINDRIAEIDRHAFIPEQARNAEKLKVLINEELKRHGKAGEAKLAYEYVLGVSDDEWREIIESLLGDRRFSVIVPLDCYDVAYYVQSRNHISRATLVRSDWFSGKITFTSSEERQGYLASQLDVPMSIARNYFDYYLNYVMVENPEDVRRYPRAICRTGFMSKPETTEYVYVRKDLRFCLGADAIRITRERLVKELEDIDSEYEEIEKSLSTLRRRSDSMRLVESTAQRLLDGGYNFNALGELKRIDKELKEERKELASLEARSAQDPEFAEIKHRVDQLESERDRLNKELTAIAGLEREQAGNKSTAEETVSRMRDQINGTDEYPGHLQLLDELKRLKPRAYENAILEYDRFLVTGNRNDNAVSDDTIRQYRRDADDKALELREKQKAYADGVDGATLPFGSTPAVMEHYYNKKNTLEVKDSEEAKDSLRIKQRERMLVFQNEFFVKIRNQVRDAMALKRQLNRDLQEVKFGTRYQFEFTEKKDGTLYEKILKYGEYFCSSVSPKALASDQIMLSDFSDEFGGQDSVTEAELNEVIDELLESKDFEKYEDYRNYMVYDVRLEGPGYGEKGARLTKQNDYNSGAGCQIPYAVILSCGLSSFFNRYENASRLIIIDEPFEKLDSANVKTMLDFFRSCGFQMIFASGNRSFDIGQGCRTLVSISGKGHKDDMRVGSTVFMGGGDDEQ